MERTRHLKTQNSKPKTRKPMTASEIIRLLDLRPHPEGGHYRETFRDPMKDRERAGSFHGDLFLTGRRRGFPLA